MHRSRGHGGVFNNCRSTQFRRFSHCQQFYVWLNKQRHESPSDTKPWVKRHRCRSSTGSIVNPTVPRIWADSNHTHTQIQALEIFSLELSATLPRGLDHYNNYIIRWAADFPPRAAAMQNMSSGFSAPHHGEPTATATM